ncbi:Rho GTPase activation protein [Lactarius indigo]|nr:Rho GTPase activation protein [Lactarius indigo]
MPFMSEPQSREVLEEHSNRLLAEFDTQLRIIGDRYLAFFRRRRRIEATYIDSLQELHRDARQLDSLSDHRIEPTTTRAAWNKIRDNLEREVSTRQQFVNTLDINVIGPLATLKDTGDQTRMGIVDHVENTISKLQQAYKKHYQFHSAHILRHPQDASNNWFGGRVSTLFRGRRGLKHAGSDEMAFDDSCRGAVFHLNICREGIAEILEYGYNCLEDLVFTTTIKDVLLGYVIGMITACATYNNDLVTNIGPEVKEALAGTDTSNLKASFRRTLSSSIPPPALYRNYRLGTYSNLVFGVPLQDCMIDGDNVPKVIRMCIEEVEQRPEGLDTYQIYSYPLGAMYDPGVQELRRRLESEQTFSFSYEDNIHSVATLLKLYLWNLPEPLCTFPLRDYVQYGQNKARYTENNFSLLRFEDPVTLGALCLHLARVASHSDKNAMTANALALTFGYCVFSGSTMLPGARVRSSWLSVIQPILLGLNHGRISFKTAHALV